jgi:phage RecT family recombinase
MSEATGTKRPTIRGEVASRGLSKREGEIDIAIRAAEARVAKHQGWFAKVAPRHIDAEQFTSLALGAIRRGSEQLKMALWQHPETFFDALSECARLGLVPGTEQFYFVPFRDGRDKVGNRPNPDKGTYSITPIVGYKGQLDMIYRTGQVTAVHCHVVRKGDKFTYRPDDTLPFHEIPANEWGQQGLGLRSQREFLTGVWAFAAMVSGGHSQPVVLGVDEVLSYRARSAAARQGGASFWGPAWPQEGLDTHMMWRKTALRRLYDNVPHSTEYQYEMARALAAVQADPLPGSNPAAIGSADDDAPAAGDDADERAFAPAGGGDEAAAAGGEPVR